MLRTRVPPCTAARGLSTHTPHPHLSQSREFHDRACPADFCLSLLKRLVHLLPHPSHSFSGILIGPSCRVLYFQLRPVTSGDVGVSKVCLPPPFTALKRHVTKGPTQAQILLLPGQLRQGEEPSGSPTSCTASGGGAIGESHLLYPDCETVPRRLTQIKVRWRKESGLGVTSTQQGGGDSELVCYIQMVTESPVSLCPSLSYVAVRHVLGPGTTQFPGVSEGRNGWTKSCEGIK